MRDEKKSFDESNSSPYDPVQVARQEGMVLGQGASGKYRRTPLLRFGFGLLGVLLIAQAFLWWLMAYDQYKEYGFLPGLLLSLAGVLMAIIGFLILKNVVRRAA